MSSARFLALLRACMVDPGEPAARSGGHARLRYWPVRVSTLIFSPVVMNSGTWICAPVSRVAGFVPPGEQSPGPRQLDVHGDALVERHHDVLLLEQVVRRVADGRLGNVRLVVVAGVHEHEVVALAVEVLHLAPVHAGLLDAHPGVEGPVDDLARHHVLQLGAHERAALAWLDVLEVHDIPELAVEVEGHAVLEIIGGGHWSCLLRACGTGSSGYRTRKSLVVVVSISRDPAAPASALARGDDPPRPP